VREDSRSELILGVFQVVKADGVGERQRRHVDEVVDQHRREEGPERLLERQGEHRQAANQVRDRQQALGRQVSVGDLGADEDGGQGGDGEGGEDPTDVGPREAEEAR
jgi:hypothetical protein